MNELRNNYHLTGNKKLWVNTVPTSWKLAKMENMTDSNLKYDFYYQYIIIGCLPREINLP